MSLKISARRPVAVCVRYAVVGLSRAISPTQINSRNSYTPRQSGDWLQSHAAAGAAWTTALRPADHKTPNLLKTQGVRS